MPLHKVGTLWVRCGIFAIVLGSGRAAAAQSLPDLVPTAVTAPGSAFVGDSVTVTVSFRNAGTALAGAPWTATVYLSSDTLITRTDLALGGANISTTLAAGANGSVTARVPTAAGTAPGTWYLGTILNTPSRINESSTTNNTFRSGVLTLNPRIDLVATAAVTGTSVVVGQKLSVGATVQNTGTAAAPAGWLVSWYLSTDTSWSTADSLLGSTSDGALAAGATTVLSGSFTANAPAGGYFVIARVDATKLVLETNEVNNNRVASSKVSVTSPPPPPPPTAPDLVFKSMAIQGSGWPSTAQPLMYVGSAKRDSVRVDLTIANTGGSSAAAGWTIGISQNLQGAVSLLKRVTFSTALAGGGAQGTLSTWVQPALWPPNVINNGTLFTVPLIVTLDDGGIIAETNDSNNATQANLEVRIGPDLVPQSVTPDRALVEGATANVSIVVANNAGSHAAPTGWDLDLLLVPLSGTGSSAQVYAGTVSTLLFPGVPLTVTPAITVPPLVYGQYGLRAVVDKRGSVPEDYDGAKGEANDTLTTGVLLSVPGPDLVVSNISIGAWNTALDSATVSYTFTNRGPHNTVPGGATVGFSVCGSYDGVTPWSSSCSGGSLRALDLPAGGSQAVTENFWLNPGDSFYLIVTVDSKSAVIEENEQNNRLVSTTKLSRP